MTYSIKSIMNDHDYVYRNYRLDNFAHWLNSVPFSFPQCLLTNLRNTPEIHQITRYAVLLCAN